MIVAASVFQMSCRKTDTQTNSGDCWDSWPQHSGSQKSSTDTGLSQFYDVGFGYWGGHPFHVGSRPLKYKLAILYGDSQTKKKQLDPFRH